MIILVDKSLYDEIKYAAEKFCNIIEKLYVNIKDNLDVFGELFGIPKELFKIIENDAISKLCALGRIDFCIDNEGRLKILEFNLETPAGLVEAIGINKFFKDEFSLKYENPNEHLREKTTCCMRDIIDEIEKNKEVRNIAVVTCWYYEDIYNTKIIEFYIHNRRIVMCIYESVHKVSGQFNFDEKRIISSALKNLLVIILFYIFKYIV